MDNCLVNTRTQGLDKFYTVESVVDSCLTGIKWDDYDFIVEPSAGNGSFLKKIPVEYKIGLDILPEDKGIVEQDFFLYKFPSDKKKVLVIGNPPFGKCSSLAIKFFNHSAKSCQTIAFIIPRTFRKTSVQNRLDLNFHLLSDTEIPLSPCSFYPVMNVKCCFQIWEKSSVPRNKILTTTVSPDMTFLSFGPKDCNNQPTPPTGADFCIRAYGGKCGEILTKGLESLRPKSWHWIKAEINKDVLIERLSLLDYSESKNTARQNSIGRAELVSLYNNFINSD